MTILNGIVIEGILMATTSIPESKVILVGEFGVGKTSLFRRFTSDTFVDTSSLSPSQGRLSTLGLDQSSKKYQLSERSVKIQLWDTGGLERVASITNSYYKYAEGALLVFSLNSMDSFHCLSQHILEILSLAENAKIFLVGNKLDLSPHEVSDGDIEMFLEQFPKFHGVFKVSCKTGQGIEAMFDEVAEKLASTPSKVLGGIDSFRLHQVNDLEADIHDEGSCCAK